MSKVIVSGVLAIDATILVDRHPAPGEELAGRQLRYTPGGKALNQATAAARSGAAVSLIGCIGQDEFGKQLMRFLEAERIDIDNVQVEVDRPTQVTFVTVDGRGANTIVYDSERTSRPSLHSVAALVRDGDILVSQFGMPTSAICEFFHLGRLNNALNIFNAAPIHPISRELLELTDIVVLNHFELAASTGRPSLDPSNHADITEAAQALMSAPNQAVIVTLGAAGCAIFLHGRSLRMDAVPALALDTTGAGDAFIGALSAGLAAGDSVASAARYANAAAAIAITRRGSASAMPSRADVEAKLRRPSGRQ